jgi:histidinol-phosphate aminotransferase
MKNVSSLANPGILKLQPYEAGKPIEELRRETGVNKIIKLASNENPLGPSPMAVSAMSHALSSTNRYPDSNAFELKEALASYLTVPKEQLTLGNGSEEVLALIAQTFVKPEGEILIPSFAFATFAIIAYKVGATPIFTPTFHWKPDLTDMAAQIGERTQLIFIANPNNPTGTYINDQELIAFLNKIPNHIFVVLDEAYYEYVEEKDYPKTLELQQQFPNLITTRSFSKIHGLAGLRLGYGIAHQDITALLNRGRLPFNINALAQVAGTAALQDVKHLQETIALNKQIKAELYLNLKKLNLSFIPSVTNFVTFYVGKKANMLFKLLLKEGIIVRPLGNYAMPEYLRVTVGLKEENDLFVQALEKVLLLI